MANWLCVTDWQNWKIIEKLLIYGVREAHVSRLRQIRIGDNIVMYCKPKLIAGIFKASSNMFEESTKLFDAGISNFESDEKFPFRINLAPNIVLSEPFDIQYLAKQLKVLTRNNVLSWIILRHTILPITEDDFDTIINAIKDSRKTRSISKTS